MSGFYGADTEQLRGFGDLLGTTSGRLSELASQLAGQVNSVEWVGSDADAFRSDFSGRVNGLFDAAEGLMDRYRTDVGGHAEEQDEASDPSDGGGLLEGIGKGLGSFLDGVLETAGDIGKGIFDVLTSTGMGSLSGLLGLGLDIADLAMEGGLPKGLGIFNKGLGVFGALTGAYQVFDNWGDNSVEGWANKIAGGLSVVSGVAAFIPGGQVVSLITGGLAAGINTGLWVAENWDSITSTVSDAVNFVGDAGEAVVDGISDAAGAVSDTVSDAAGAVSDAVGDVADGVGDFVGGLF